MAFTGQNECAIQRRFTRMASALGNLSSEMTLKAAAPGNLTLSSWKAGCLKIVRADKANGGQK